MADEKPTDVETPKIEKTEDSVEEKAEKLEDAPKGKTDSKDTGNGDPGEKGQPAEEASPVAKPPVTEEPKKLPAVEETPALEEAVKPEALPEPKLDEVIKAPAVEPSPEPAAAVVAEKKAAKKPAKPAAKKPAKPAAKKPSKPAVDKPAEPAVDKPAEPAVDKPAEPAVDKPAEPAVDKPAESAKKAAEGEAAVEVEPREPERTFADELREEYGDIETAKLDILPDLERKRDRLNALAEEHKFKRDRLNSITKQLAEERDIYNAQVRELVGTANENRNRRNTLNTEVKEAKVLRDELNKKATELNETVVMLKRERQGETGGPSLGRLRNERKALEFKGMTQVLSADKEKELMAQIQRINIQIEEQERKMEENKEVRTALMESREAKEAAEAQHRHVSDLARQAQTSHDTMIELYEKADDLRKKADDCQGRFINNKQMADAEHKAHIELIRKVHDYDKFISGLRRRDRRVRKDRQEKAQKKVAEDMMDRFKKGEKLSTEDLLSLQTERY